MADQRPPSFFHILMNPSSPHLPLPLKFVMKHLRNEILEDPIIKSANGGYMWKSKMKKVDDHNFCLVDGWCNVVKDVGFLFGDFLLFRYVGNSVFSMHVYGVNGCEKILVPKIKVVDYEVEKEEEEYEVCDADDDDDDMEEDEDVVYDMDEDDHHHVEDEDDVEFDDDGDEDHDMEEDDDELYDVDDGVEDENDVEFVYGGDEDDDDDDDDVEDENDIEFVYGGDEDDVDVDGDNGDPFFILTSSKSNINKLRFSPAFVALAKIDTRETIILKNDDGSEKEMTVQSDKKSKSTSYYVVAGWKEFQQSNGISEGDKCVFKFITSEDKICLAKITKKKTLARPLRSGAKAPQTEVDDSMDDKDAEDDNDEDEDVELVDEEDPLFVVTITPTHNRVLRMPADFVRLAGIDTKRTLTVRSLDGNEMAMRVKFDTQYGYPAKKRYFLLKGWKDFMQGTNISEGDKCVFKFITSEDKLCLAKITKPPPASEALATEVNDDDDDKHENEDVEPVDDVDHFFVATMTKFNNWRLCMPTNFVELAGIDTKENITMISLDAKEFPMVVRKYKRNLSTIYFLSSRWNAFIRSNNISQGDKCVFKYITREDKMCLVKIIKGPAKEVDVDDRDPSFVVTITMTHNRMLPLPPDFIALAGIDTKENIIMKSIDGNESEIAVRLDKRFINSAHYYLSLGWVAFKQSTNISQGDECVFKYITSEDKMCLVKITKASAKEVDEGMDVEDDNDTNEDENVKPVDDTDPFFVVTIIPSHSRMLLLPTDFVELARIGTKENIIIKSLDGNETQMALQSYKLKWLTRYCFAVGWTAFKRCNNISDGDECVFKYIKSEDKMCLEKLTKKLPVDNDDMGDEDVVEKGKGEDAKLVDEDHDNENEVDDYDYDGDDDDGDPSFILNISKANQYKLRFSPDFVALARIDTRETITLKNADGYEKEMPVQSDKKRNSMSYYVVKGWKEFQQSNDISEGDKCVCKFITSEDKICLAKITKTKTRARPLPPAAKPLVTEVDADDVDNDDGMDDKDSEDVNDKDEDEDVELDDGADPFFVATISTSHKNSLYLPSDFARLAGIDTKENISVIGLDGDECQMSVRKDTRKLSTRCNLSHGWRAFMRSNNISQGDKCAFKYITSEDKMYLAKINKAGAKKVNAEAKKINVDDEDPSFVVTITTTNKSMLRFWSDFVKLARINKKKTIVFKNLNGYEKEMAVQRDNKLKWTKVYFVASGWKELLRDTDISEGDICVFKYIRSEDKICLAKITKKETLARPLPPAIESPVTEVDDAAASDDDENEDAERVDDGDPSFVATINVHMLYMPADFVRSTGIDTKKILTVLGPDGYEKEMPVRYDKRGESTRYYYVTKGWTEFRQHNAILVGDKCVFKFITSDDKLCLATIGKKKTPTSPLPPAAAEDDNEDVERVDGEDPFFMATINHKFMLRLPSDFVALAKIDTKENIILKSLDGNERQIRMQSYKQFRLTWYHFSIGWPSFRRSNNISKGDECVFKYIRCEDKMCLVKVTKRKTQARSETEVDDGLDNKDAEDNMDKDEDEGEDTDFDDDDDPFFVVTITRHNFKSCVLRLPVEFVRSAGIDTKKTITLKSLDGYEEEMPVRCDSKYHYQAKCYNLSKGWTDFARSNNISVGDKCVFKFITSEDKLCLAKITKAPATEVDVEVDGGMDGNDADRDVELADGIFFVVTITTIHKSMLRLPSAFLGLSGIYTKENIIIKSLDGNERLMALRSYKQNKSKHYCLSMGWPAFMRSNSISEGDECVFKYIASEGKMCLAKVIKTKTQTRLSSPATVVKKKRGRPTKVTMAENVKITVEEVVKRKRGRPPASPRATKDVKRKKGWEPHGHSADMEGVDKCVEVGKRPRGRPAKRVCGKAPQQK